jgi:hypothetical protein
MNINRNNYEAYFLDYRENNLSPGQVAELLIFLEQNPDLKNEFESFKYFQLVPDKNTRFEHKENLKKNDLIPTDNIDSSNYDNYILADLEGDLSEDDDLELKAFISLNPKTRLEYNFYRSTFLKPDKSVQFIGKDKLKKTGLLAIYRTQMVYALAVAASVIILLGIYLSFPDRLAQRGLTDSIEKLTTLPLALASPILNTVSEIQRLQKIEYRFSEQPAQLVNASFKGREENNSQDIARVEARQIASIAPDHTIGLQQLKPSLRNREILSLAATDLAPNADEEAQKSFVSRFIAGLAGKVIKIENPERKSFLDYTIDGYNLMADKNVILEKEVDKTGKIIAYSLNGENISFSRNKNTVKE